MPSRSARPGSGLGLNFLALWRAWRDDPARSAALHVLAVEGHPSLRRIWPRCWRATRAAGRPGARAGGPMAAATAWLAPARIRRRGRHADLGLWRAQTVAPRLDACVDAYFLDGFAPGRNPRMGTGALRELAPWQRPARPLATWACTGELRRALSESGFDARRETGYGGKWHMTVATARAEGARAAQARARIRPRGRHVGGRGPAGAGIAQGLALRGWRVTVLDAARAGGVAAHAGHVAAALTPVVARDDNARAWLSRAGMRARWRVLLEGAAPRVCGTVQVERDEGRGGAGGHLEMLAFPAEWVRQVDRDEAGALAGMPVARGGAYFAQGMLMQPGRLIETLLAARRDGAAGAGRARPSGWRAMAGAGRGGPGTGARGHDDLANAAGARGVLDASGLLEPWLPRVAQMHARWPARSRCCRRGAGGRTALHHWRRGLSVARYRRGLRGRQHLCPWRGTGADQRRGAAGHVGQGRRLAGRRRSGLECADARQPARLGGWRAVLPGRLPAVGNSAHAPGLWMAAGYASRGLSWSALMGDLIGARLMGEPSPLERDLAGLVTPR